MDFKSCKKYMVKYNIFSPLQKETWLKLAKIS